MLTKPIPVFIIQKEDVRVRRIYWERTLVTDGHTGKKKGIRNMRKDTKQEWFKDAKYGLFIHWGLFSLLEGEYKGEKTDRIAEWIMNYMNIPV